MTPADVRLHLGEALLRRLRTAPREVALFSPDGKARTASLQRRREGVTLEVQAAGLWTLLALR